MSLRPLIINATAQQHIKEALEQARKKCTPWDMLRQFARPDDGKKITLADKAKMGPGVEALIGRSVSVLIPRGFRASISFEEQPVGIVRHLSVSIDKKGRLPSPPAVEMILAEFGFEPLMNGTSRIWLEEFEPGHFAVNVVQIESERQEGNA